MGRHTTRPSPPPSAQVRRKRPDLLRSYEEVKAGEKLYVPLEKEGLRLAFDGKSFSAIPEYANHPMTMVSWFGAYAYAEFYGWRIPTDVEWEKAARGAEFVDGYGLPFPWGTGFYNGRTYEDYETLDSASPYGLYDMAGNVWQWVGDDLPKQHYRYMRGGSFYTYEVDLRVWKQNSAGPVYYSPAVGFRCARDL